MTDRNLIDRAAAAMKSSYSPYSRFPVGAALECEDGTVYTGCNIENAALGCTVCAERVALFKAISDNKRNFKRIAIYAETGRYTYPCGTCRQTFSEFSPNLEMLCVRADGRYVSYKLNELLPYAFGKEWMG